MEFDRVKVVINNYLERSTAVIRWVKFPIIICIYFHNPSMPKCNHYINKKKNFCLHFDLKIVSKIRQSIIANMLRIPAYGSSTASLVHDETLHIICNCKSVGLYSRIGLQYVNCVFFFIKKARLPIFVLFSICNWRHEFTFNHISTFIWAILRLLTVFDTFNYVNVLRDKYPQSFINR